MKNKIIIGIVTVVILGLIGVVVWLMKAHNEDMKDKAQLEELKDLAEMEKAEMENEYQNFAMQYHEMKMQINNDSLVAQLEAEQKKTEAALAELQRTKATDAKEIMRLKEELKTLRAILQDFVHQVDSLQRLNEQLNNENQNLRNTNQQQQEHISNLNTEREALTEKVMGIGGFTGSNIVLISGTESINYTFNTEKLKNIEHLRLYVSGTNLFTITGYSGFDPEMTVSANSRGEGDRANGIDWGTYPNSRTYTFGMNLTF